jgi:outer membrane protein TolC
MVQCGGARRFGLPFGLLLWAAPAAAQPPPRTLAEVMVYAREHAPRVTARRAAREESQAVAQARGWWLPESPVASGEWTRKSAPGGEEIRDRVWEAGLWLEPLGQAFFRRHAAGAERARALAEIDAEARHWAADVAWSYYDLLRWQWMRARAGNRAKTGGRLAEIVARRFAAGDASQLEVDLAGVEASADARRVLEVELGLRQAAARLAAGIGWPSGAPFPELDSLQLVPAWPDTADLHARALRHRPELVLARSTVAASDAAARLATAQLLPAAEITGFTGTDDGADLRGVRVALSVPFLGPAAAEKRVASASQRRTAASHQAAQRDAEAEIAATRDAADLTMQQVRLFEVQVLPGLDLARARFYKAYQMGEIDLTTLLLHEQRCREAEESFANALADYTAALRDLEWAAGLPVLSGETLAEEVQR